MAETEPDGPRNASVTFCAEERGKEKHGRLRQVEWPCSEACNAHSDLSLVSEAGEASHLLSGHHAAISRIKEMTKAITRLQWRARLIAGRIFGAALGV